MRKLNLNIIKNCEFCGDEIRIKITRDIKRKRFCSRKCAWKVVGRLSQKSGEESPGWKGGRYTNKNGYVLVYVGNGRYKMEHRIVMEKHLGRELYSFENIHHINGVRNDNRIENLELWVKPQQIGIRLKDFLAYYGVAI